MFLESFKAIGLTKNTLLTADYEKSYSEKDWFSLKKDEK